MAVRLALCRTRRWANDVFWNAGHAGLPFLLADFGAVVAANRRTAPAGSVAAQNGGKHGPVALASNRTDFDPSGGVVMPNWKTEKLFPGEIPSEEWSCPQRPKNWQLRWERVPEANAYRATGDVLSGHIFTTDGHRSVYYQGAWYQIDKTYFEYNQGQDRHDQYRLRFNMITILETDFLELAKAAALEHAKGLLACDYQLETGMAAPAIYYAGPTFRKTIEEHPAWEQDDE